MLQSLEKMTKNRQVWKRYRFLTGGTHRRGVPPFKGSAVLSLRTEYTSGVHSFQITTGMLLNKWKVNSEFPSMVQKTLTERLCAKQRDRRWKTIKLSKM